MKEKTWKVISGYQRMVSGQVTAGQSNVQIYVDTPSNNLTLRVTHIATYALDQAAWSDGGGCTWITPFWPYNAIKDQMGAEWQPQELSDRPELNPGQAMRLAGTNPGAQNHTLGFIIRGELGYYE